MRLVLLFATTYYFTLQYCCSYRQIARPQSYEPNEPNYQYPLESAFQGEHFILYPGKYDITLRHPGVRRHRHRKVFLQQFKTWDQERELHQALQIPPIDRIEHLNNTGNGLENKTISDNTQSLMNSKSKMMV